MEYPSGAGGKKRHHGLARPGANVTGFSTLAEELSGKRLELLRETVPVRRKRPPTSWGLFFSRSVCTS